MLVSFIFYYRLMRYILRSMHFRIYYRPLIEVFLLIQNIPLIHFIILIKTVHWFLSINIFTNWLITIVQVSRFKPSLLIISDPCNRLIMLIKVFMTLIYFILLHWRWCIILSFIVSFIKFFAILEVIKSLLLSLIISGII